MDVVIEESREAQPYQLHQEGGGVTMNFFTALPPEMVLSILLWLDLSDVLSCMSVCRAWLHTLSSMEPYWLRACEKIGLSRRVLDQLLVVHRTCRAVLFACLRHRRTVTGSSPRPVQLQNTSFPSNMSYTNQYSKGQCLVGTLRKDFKPYRVVVHSLGEQEMPITFSRGPTYPCISQNRIVWAYLHHDQFLISATGSGIWSVYDLKRNRGPLLVQWNMASLIYDPGIRMACCSKCGLICTAELFAAYNKDPFWDLKITEMNYTLTHAPSNSRSRKEGCTLPLPKLVRFTLYPTEFELDRSHLGEKKVALLCRSTDANQGGVCMLHLLLVQWGNTITGYKLYYKSRESELLLSPVLTRHYHVPCQNYNVAMRLSGLNTEFTLSSDHSLIGVIFQCCLVTWEIDSASASSPSFPPASSADIVIQNYRHEVVRLLALGHVYSIVGLEFSASFLVVYTRTGQPLLEFADFAINHHRMMLPFFSFISSVEDDWLSDVSRPCRTTILYWNRSNRCLEGVALGKPLAEPG